LQRAFLFTGDLFLNEHAPPLTAPVLGGGKVLGENCRRWPPGQIVAGARRTLLDWPQSAGNALKVYLDVLDRRHKRPPYCPRAIPLGQAVEIIAQSQSGGGRCLTCFNPRNATVAFTELEWNNAATVFRSRSSQIDRKPTVLITVAP